MVIRKRRAGSSKRSSHRSQPPAWIIVTIPFGNFALAELLAIHVDKFGYIGPFVVKRHLTMPAKPRATSLEFLGELAAHLFHLFIAEARLTPILQYVRALLFI